MTENTQQPQRISSEEKEKLLNSSIRALISLAPNSEEADKIVEKFKSKELPDDELSRYQKKYSYITVLFNIDANARKSCIKTDATELDKIKSDYYSLLSILILKRWQ